MEERGLAARVICPLATVRILAAKILKRTGVITFVSQAWGGRTTDKFITEQCGLLQKLLPGDEVFADHGFTVQESVGLNCAKLEIPPFTRGKPQLSPVEVDKAGQLSRVRIHVERFIGLLRNILTILQSTLPQLSVFS